MYYTYVWFDPKDNIPIYVGKGKKRRAWQHIRLKTRLGNTLRKRLEQGFTISPVIFNQSSEEDALHEEIRLIALYGREDLGYGTLFNLTDGGESTTGRIMTQLEKDHLHKINIGKASTKKGKPLTEEEKVAHRIRSDKLRGKKASQETKDKMSATRKDISQETRDKLSRAVTAIWAARKLNQSKGTTI